MTTTTSASVSSRLSRQRIAEMRVRCQQHPNDIELQRDTAKEFVAAGLPGEAIPILRRLAALTPGDTAITIELAALLTAAEQHADAMNLYRALADAAPDSVDAHHNYGVAACHAKQYDQAIIAFERKLQLDPKCFETLNDLAVLYSLVGRPDDSARMYRRCLTVNPRYDRARENAFQFFFDTQRFSEGAELADQLLATLGRDRDVESWKQRLQSHGTPGVAGSTVRDRPDDTQLRVAGKRIGFVASSGTFLKPIVEHFGRCNKIRTFTGSSLRELADLLQWADLVWYEWCDQLVVEGSKLPRRAKTVCRLHSYEAFTNMPQQVNWANIDHLLLVSETVGEILDDAAPIQVERSVVHNGIDPSRFPLNRPPQLGKRIGSVGYINYKKNPSLLLQTFKAIHEWDPEFEFHIAGQHQDPRIKVYMDNLLPRLHLPVRFHGWIDDMPDFYSGMDYVISTSLFESFHYSIAEGMLSGCLPLIHTWRGAERLYPNDVLFDTPQDAVALIQRCQGMDIGPLREGHRQFIISRYNWKDKLDEIDCLLDRVLHGERAQQSIAVHQWPEPVEPVSSLNLGTVSIIIPVHNDAAGALRTLESVTSQTYRDTELILVDDGSTDDLGSMLAEYDGRMTVIRQTHRGCAAALNTGIQASSGQFITIAQPGDTLAPDKLDQQLRLFEQTPSLGVATCSHLGDEAPFVALSALLVRRELFNEIGWFEEYAPFANDPAALAQSLIQRAAALSSVRHTPESLVAASSGHGASVSKAIRSQVEKSTERWASRITSVRARDTGKRVSTEAASPSEHAGMTIALVGAHDPRGQMAMWAEALTQYTPHTVRVLTHTERTGCPADLVINRRGAAKHTDARPKAAMAVIAEAEHILADAELIIFAAGLAPGCDRHDARLQDTDEQPFGTLEWSSVIKNKRCAALLFGTQSVRHNLTWYRDHFAQKKWPLLTCDPDVHRWLGNSIFVPRIVSRTGNRFAPSSPESGQVVVLHPGGRSRHEGGNIFREAAQQAKSQHANLTFGLYDRVSWDEVQQMKRQAHIGFDRIAPGTGHFGIDSLENSALGLVNIVYCDPFARALLAETLGTSECPWVQPTTVPDLTQVFSMYAQDENRLRNDMNATRQWFDKWWNEKRIAPLIATTLESLV
jgi:glycosyltransferase involved in cell wall biosynthesis